MQGAKEILDVLFNSVFINSTNDFVTSLDSRLVRTTIYSILHLRCSFTTLYHDWSLNPFLLFLSSLDIPTTHAFGILLPSIWRRDRRDIDGSLGLSTLTLYNGLAYISSVFRIQSVNCGMYWRTVGKRVVLYCRVPLQFQAFTITGNVNFLDVQRMFSKWTSQRTIFGKVSSFCNFSFLILYF